MKKNTDSAFRDESPSFYRLSQDLARYSYPLQLQIERVRLDPDGNMEYFTVDDEVTVEVKLEGLAYEILVIGPTSARKKHVCALPPNSVLVPQVTGQTVAQAVVAAVRGGLGVPRRDRDWHRALRRLLGTDMDALLGSEFELPSFRELSTALERLDSDDDRWKVIRLLAPRPTPQQLSQEELETGIMVFQELFGRHGLSGPGCPERAWRHIFRCLLRRPEVRSLDIVEMLLYLQLPLDRSQHHRLAEEIHALWQVMAEDYVAWPKAEVD